MRPPPAKKIAVYTIPLTSTLVAFRIVRVADPADPALVESMRSHFDLGRPPRKTENEFVVLHMGISCWRTEAGARGLATAYPKIGAHIARLELGGGRGFNFNASATDATGGQHLTIWGDPIMLAAQVVDVVPV